MQFVLGLLGLINCFLNRAFNVSCDWSLLHQEISIFLNIFHQNGYPHRIFSNCVKKIINNKLNPKAKDENSKNENNRCITLPYVGNASLVLKKLLSPNLKKYIIIAMLTLDHLKFPIIFH